MLNFIETSLWYFTFVILSILLCIALMEMVKDRSKNAFKGSFFVLSGIFLLFIYAYFRGFPEVIGNGPYSFLTKFLPLPSLPEKVIDENQIVQKMTGIDNSLKLLKSQSETLILSRAEIENSFKEMNLDSPEKIKAHPKGSFLYKEFKLICAEQIDNENNTLKLNKSRADLNRLQRQLKNKQVLTQSDFDDNESFKVMEINQQLKGNKPEPLADFQADKELERLFAK